MPVGPGTDCVVQVQDKQGGARPRGAGPCPEGAEELWGVMEQGRDQLGLS